MAVVARSELLGGVLSLVLASTASSAMAATPSVEEALKLTPMQRDVDFDQPSAAEAAKSTIKAEQLGNQTGWVVRNASGQILRRFVDTNADNVVDLWSYYSAGIEVYRDIDQNFNGKADQYRWLNTAGTRWGVDADEDGRIDSWKLISPEEVSAEVVRAIAENDSSRFTRLLATSDELSGLGLGAAQAKTLSAMTEQAPARFKTLLLSQKAPGSKLTAQDSASKPKWVHFGGSQPGLIPAGTDGSTKDLEVYESVAAMVQRGDKHDQIPIGTLIRVGDAWRLLDAPSTGDTQQLASNGIFYPGTVMNRPGASEGSEPAVDGKLQDLMAKLEGLDKSLTAATTPAEQAKLHAERADIVEQISEGSTGDDRALWLRQLADTVGAAAQQGAYPGGVARLKDLREKLVKSSADDELIAYIEFRYLTAEYGLSVQAEKADFVSIQKGWIDNLEKFVKDHPKSSDTPEAMLQLAIAQEFAGQEEVAKKWYTLIVDDFPKSAAAKKAGGAKTRLDSVGKTITLRGPSLSGQSIDIASLRGKVVVIHYWATWCQPCKADLAQLRELQAKYGKDGLAIVGISLDSQREDLVAFLKTNKLAWPQIYEPGGLDSPAANALGILTLPTTLLLDKQGKVVNRSANVAGLDREVGAMLR
jgi:thiol-disulfide isomerase/thioredoxin